MMIGQAKNNSVSWEQNQAIEKALHREKCRDLCFKFRLLER
jgi:hypothetical protein